jgi:prephenate dehydrogenase
MFRRAAIIGVGLIGGSLALALREHGLAKHIVGTGPGIDSAKALQLGVIDEAALNIQAACNGADLVVLACPPGAMVEVMKAIAQTHMAPRVIITDVGSTKQSVIRSAQHYLGSWLPRFVPSHPIAGSERRGPQAARADLFKRARWIVCPISTSATEAVDQWTQCLTTLGAEVSTMPAPEHDALYAAVSHLPHGLAFVMCAALAQSPISAAAIKAAGAGLRDTTRIGASDPGLWADILLDNQAQVLLQLQQFKQALGVFEAALVNNNRQALEQQMQVASLWRQALQG